METDWKKRYSEALERARALREEAIEKEYVNDYVKDYEAIFPELAESEDERIIEELIGHCKDLVRKNRGDKVMLSIYEPWLAWLEKQKEQKPAECGKTMINGEPISSENKAVDIPCTEWSEEDKNKIESIKGLITMGRFADTNTIRTIWKLLDSLRPSWKPSEEDLMMLEHIIEQYKTGNKNSKVMGYLPRVEELSFLKKVLSKWKN